MISPYIWSREKWPSIVPIFAFPHMVNLQLRCPGMAKLKVGNPKPDLAILKNTHFLLVFDRYPLSEDNIDYLYPCYRKDISVLKQKLTL